MYVNMYVIFLLCIYGRVGSLCRFDYQVDPRRGDRFYSEVRKYFPALPDESLQPGYSGIRPKLSGKGQPPTDFVIQVQRNILLCINSVRLSYRVEI